jgi:hypothetical protein
MSPIDGIRQDLALARRVIDESPPKQEQVEAAATDSEQLGLF